MKAPSVPSMVGALGVVFVVLKLCGVIAWSWWWVTAPVWIPVAVLFVVFGGLLAYSALDECLDYLARQKERRP